MAKKPEARVIHPRQILNSLDAYHADAQNLLAVARHAASFLADDSLDPKKVCKTLAPMLKEAADRLEKWNDAD